MKTCANCKHSYRRPEKPKYMLCRKAEGEGDERLCGKMREGPCGPDADLWEPRDGQA